MFAAIVFDLDNTLINRNAAFYAMAQSTFQDQKKVQELIKLDQGGYGNRKLLFSRWEELGGEKLDAPNFGTFLSRYLCPNAQLLDTLKTLTTITSIGILTNGGSVAQKMKWRAAGLDSVVPRNRLWISQEIGLEKPDPAAFVHVCQLLKVHPEECLFVGDQPILDIEGAKSAGMSTMLVSKPLTAEVIYRDLFTGTHCES